MATNGINDLKILANPLLSGSKNEKIIGKVNKIEEKISKMDGLLSCGQMEALSALCDAFLPAIDVSDGKNTDDSTRRFYETSASMAGTPHHVKWWLTERLEHPKLYLSILSLWLLSTWIGTFILCGRASLSNHFPYFQRFSQISQKKREQIVLSWSQSYFFLIRLFFVACKFLTLLAFFTQVNEKNDNISWKALGYPGPDPEFKNHLKKTKETKDMEPHQDQQDHAEKEEFLGPLRKGLINLNQEKETVMEKLSKQGFNVSLPDSNHATKGSLSPSFVIKCDAIVVGSGSGGGVIAGILAKAGYKVLVLEKGSYCARNNLSLLEGDAMNTMYLGNGLLATSDLDVVMLAGSTVGGGSTINWSASIKTPEHVTKEWSECFGLELFESRLYKEAMDVVCEKMGVQSEVENEGFNNMILRKGCQELGYSVENIPRNSSPDHYCGWCCLGCKDGKKKGTTETWLMDLVDSGNGVILPECEAIEVIHKQRSNKAEKSVASGVAFTFHHQGVKNVCIVESKVTVVACGALGTPVLLKRSGLKNPNVGKNLHLHPVAMAWGYFPDAPVSSPWPELEKKSYEGGIMTAMSKVVSNFEGSGYGAVIQTPALHPGMFSLVMPWLSGFDIKNRMCKFSRTAHIFALARDKSSGIVSPTSISYKLEPIDEENLKRGLEKVLRILAAAGAEEIGTHHINGKVLNVKKADLSEFERFVKEESSRALTNLSTPICSAHQMGSCKMGVDSKSSVVNSMGETWEVEGLYIADSSVFPTALGVNPMVTIQAIAYCTSQAILGALERKRSI